MVVIEIGISIEYNVEFAKASGPIVITESLIRALNGPENPYNAFETSCCVKVVPLEADG